MTDNPDLHLNARLDGLAVLDAAVDGIQAGDTSRLPEALHASPVSDWQVLLELATQVAALLIDQYDDPHAVIGTLREHAFAMHNGKDPQ